MGVLDPPAVSGANHDSKSAGLINNSSSQLATALRTAFVPKWVASTAVAANEYRMSPDGTTIKRISSGTTRVNWDATEMALWTIDGHVAAGTAIGQVAVWDGTTWQPNTPTAVTKADVGLGNVDNTSDINKPVSTAQQTALDGKAAMYTPINYIAAATTIAAWMHQRHMQAEDASTVITVPTDAAATIPIGFEVDFAWGNNATANVTFTPMSGVTLNSRGTARKLAGQYAIATLRKTAANTWWLVGDLTV